MRAPVFKKKDNLWILFNGKEYVIGLTQEASEELGAITYASLPKVNQKMTAGEMLVELEAEKAVSEFTCPLAGVISSINEKIDTQNNDYNDNDEMNDWLVSLKDVDPADFEKL